MNFYDIHTWVTLGVLTLLEVILCLDNVVFLVLVSHNLPLQQQKLARQLGLSLATLMRLVLLSVACQILQLNTTVFSVFNRAFSWCDIFMLLGGGVLVAQSLRELYRRYQLDKFMPLKQSTLFKALLQIALLDLVFSLDNVMTAVTITRQYGIMATAIIIATVVMVLLSEQISYFVSRYARVKVLAIIIVLLIGILLLLKSFKFIVPDYFIYVCLLVLALIILPDWQRRGAP